MINFTFELLLRPNFVAITSQKDKICPYILREDKMQASKNANQ